MGLDMSAPRNEFDYWLDSNYLTLKLLKLIRICFLRKLRIQKAVLHVNEILSQHVVLGWDLIPDHPILFTNCNVA
jgi:hypothetical protein